MLPNIVVLDLYGCDLLRKIWHINILQSNGADVCARDSSISTQDCSPSVQVKLVSAAAKNFYFYLCFERFRTDYTGFS